LFRLRFSLSLLLNLFPDFQRFPEFQGCGPPS
jgi:hypothetical protein